MIEPTAKSVEYRARAAAETAHGDATRLDEVRRKHTRAAQAWTDLADAEDSRESEKAARRAAAGPGPEALDPETLDPETQDPETLEP